MLTRKDVSFEWTESCQITFEKLKMLITEAPLLAYADFTKPFLLETDASKEGLGDVLAQRAEPGPASTRTKLRNLRT